MATTPVIGLDIGSQQIKIAELRPGKTGLTITALGIGQTPPGVIQNNIITDPATMGAVIKQIMRESGITIKKVVGCISGQNAVVIRIIEVPRMTDSELKETMKWEVERHVPFAPSETMLDYQPLVQYTAEARNAPNIEVLLAVAQQDAVNNYLNAIYAAGLDPVAIDIEPLAVARAILDIGEGGQPVARPQFLPGQEMTLDGPPPETVAIVNIGAANTDISIFQADQLTFPRSLPLAGDSLTRAIAEALQYTPEQAERVKREYGTVQLDRMAVYTGTHYDGEGGFDDAPQFDEEGGFNLNEEGQDHPFDLNAGDDAAFGETGFRATPSGRLGEPQFDDLERTQPMSRRTLNLAKPLPSEPLPFMSSGIADFGLPPMEGTVDADKLRDDIFEAIAPVLGELASELRRSLDYYRSRGAQISVDRVLLTGGSANLTNLAAFLQNELQLPVAVANPLAALPVTSKQYDPSYLPLIGPAFTVAVGLAARDAVFGANPLPKAPKAPKVSRKAAAAAATGASV